MTPFIDIDSDVLEESKTDIKIVLFVKCQNSQENKEGQ